MFSAEVRQSLRIVWFVVSFIFLVALAAPFALGRDRIAQLLPPCEWKVKYHRECAFCGMTTAFLDISHGQFNDAERANHAGIPLYLLFVSNELGVAAFVRRKGFTTCKR